MIMETDTFTRIFALENQDKVLTLYQKNVGDVNCVVWDAALVLAKYLNILCTESKLGKNWLQGKNVLELGAGVGCVGMTAACLGAHVIVTDLETTLPILTENILMNKNQWEDIQGSVEAQIIEWGTEFNSDSLNNFKPDIIVLSDCVYYSESIDPLISTLKSICDNSQNSYILLSQELRDTPQQIITWQKFLHNITKFFHTEVIPQSQQHPVYSSDDIYLMKLIKIQ